MNRCLIFILVLAIGIVSCNAPLQSNFAKKKYLHIGSPEGSKNDEKAVFEADEPGDVFMAQNNSSTEISEDDIPNEKEQEYTVTIIDSDLSEEATHLKSSDILTSEIMLDKPTEKMEVTSKKAAYADVKGQDKNADEKERDALDKLYILLGATLLVALICLLFLAFGVVSEILGVITVVAILVAAVEAIILAVVANRMYKANPSEKASHRRQTALFIGILGSTFLVGCMGFAALLLWMVGYW